MKDLEHEFIGEKNELLESVCDLTKQLYVEIWRKLEPRLLPCRIRGADGAKSTGGGIILRSVQYL